MRPSLHKNGGHMIMTKPLLPQLSQISFFVRISHILLRSLDFYLIFPHFLFHLIPSNSKFSPRQTKFLPSVALEGTKTLNLPLRQLCLGAPSHFSPVKYPSSSTGRKVKTGSNTIRNLNRPNESTGYWPTVSERPIKRVPQEKRE